MAKWRAIHKKISKSAQIARMSEFAQFLFERAMVHADDWGVVTGEPLELKLTAIPSSERGEEDFDVALQEMEDAGLVWRYWPDGWGPLVQFINFDEYQPKILIGNRTDPQLPLYSHHPNYKDYPELHWKTLEKTGKPCKTVEIEKKTSQSKSRSKSKSVRKGRARDSRLDHPAIKGYNEIASVHIPIPLRDDWINCAEEVGCGYLLESVKLWIGYGWKKLNVNGIMDWSRKGRPDGRTYRGRSSKAKESGKRDPELEKWAKEQDRVS